MANANLFSTKSRARAVQTNTVNSAGGRAYKMSDKHALAQYAATGMFGNTYYADGKAQLDKVLELANSVEPEFLAKVAVYSRKYGYLKDMPALLVAVLASRDIETCKKVFADVIDNGRMLRNFVQIMRSGVTGRKSLGTAPKKMVQAWLRNASDDQIFRSSVGNDPSLADVIKMVHPTPETKSRDHLYAYITERNYDGRSLPQLVKQYERFKKGTPGDREVPNVPFQLLDSCDLTDAEWLEIAKNAKWQMTRMNLNTFARHGVFDVKGMTNTIAQRLADPKEVERARAFPYQLMQAWRHVGGEVPARVKSALEDAMESAVANVPPFEGKIYAAVDFSGSMGMGVNAGAWSNSPVSCNDIASLFASCLVRQNPDTEVYRFDTRAYKVELNARDSIMKNAQKIGQRGGGTDCSCVLAELNRQNAKGDAVFILSDMESWADRGYYSGGTGVQTEWDKFVRRNPGAKLICMDLAANSTCQAVNRKGQILNVGGFSDSVFKVTQSFLESDGTDEYWTNLIESGITLD
jgi:60 kDa SS-A/Ro ribonucleoprotein